MISLKWIKSFLLTSDKFKVKLYLKQLGFTYCSRESFTKHCESILKFKETGNLKHLHGN